MRVSTLLVVAALALLPVVLAAAAHFDVIDASNVEQAFEGLQAHAHWQKFKAQHNKAYASKEHELNRSDTAEKSSSSDSSVQPWGAAQCASGRGTSSAPLRSSLTLCRSPVASAAPCPQ